MAQLERTAHDERKPEHLYGEVITGQVDTAARLPSRDVARLTEASVLPFGRGAAPEAFRRPPVRRDPERHFRFDVLLRGENRWTSNHLRFVDEAAALAHARGMSSRWNVIDKVRVVHADAPQGDRYLIGSEHQEWLARRA
jgi:hypothetical protein